MKFKSDKGVAGLTILLSLIVMLFVIGLLVMLFAIMSGKLANTDSLYYRTGANSVTGEAVTQSELIANSLLANGGARGAECSIVAVYNNTIAGRQITAGNYTVDNCQLTNSTSEFITVDWAVNYTYTYLIDSSGAVGVINATNASIASTTDWFDIFIVIGAMVVLILLTVIIITAIRSSGMIDGASSSGANKVGTA